MFVRRPASTARLAWIAIALLVWVAFVPALHADHNDHLDHVDHADACPYCHPAQSTSFLPADSGPFLHVETTTLVVAPRPVSALGTRTGDPWNVRGPPVRA